MRVLSLRPNLSNTMLLLIAATINQVSAIGKFWSHLKPTSFDKGDEIDIHVGQLWSLVLGALPYDYYSLRWCDSVEGHTYDKKKLPNKSTYDEDNDEVNENVHESPYTYFVGDNRP